MDEINTLESQALELVKEQRWAEARTLWLEAMRFPMEPIRQVKILKNVMATYQRECDQAGTLSTAEQALETLDIYQIGLSSDQGAILRGQFRAVVERHQPGGRSAALAGYVGAAAIGALVGCLFDVSNWSIAQGKVHDLRHAGAAVGAILYALFGDHLLVICRRFPRFSAVFFPASTALLLYLLLSSGFKVGLLTIAFLLLFELFGNVGFPMAKSRRKTDSFER